MSADNKGAPPAIAHTVLDAKYLAWEMGRRYALKAAVRAQLLYRGMNDVYIISDDSTRYALRVWRAVHDRDLRKDVAFELDFLEYLKRNGFPASGPIRAKDDSTFFCFDSPEGVRPIALYDWAPGSKFGDCLDIGIAETIGGLFARMHLLGLNYKGMPASKNFSTAGLIANIPAVLEFVADRPEDVRDYPIIAHNMTQRLEDMLGQDLPRGICHRDFHPSNVHVSPEGTITFLDFDGCSEDFLMQDVQNYVWGNDFYAFSSSYADAFERGYRQVRPFTADEERNREFFLLRKAYNLISGLSVASNSVGRGTLRFRNLEWFSQTIKARARALDLL